MITKHNRWRSISIKIHLPTTTKRQNTSHQTNATIHRKFTLKQNHPSLQNKTTDVVIQQHSRKLLMMDILMSETCWAHKKWNKISSDIKLVFHSSNITVMRGPINIRFTSIQSNTRVPVEQGRRTFTLHISVTLLFVCNGTILNTINFTWAHIH